MSVHLFNVQIVLTNERNTSEQARVVVPVVCAEPYEWEESTFDIDGYIEDAEKAAKDSLRPFLNNHTLFEATVFMPVEIRPRPPYDDPESRPVSPGKVDAFGGSVRSEHMETDRTS